MTWAIRYFSRSSEGRTQSRGMVVDHMDRPMLFPSKRRADKFLRVLVKSAEPGEWYEVEKRDDGSAD